MNAISNSETRTSSRVTRHVLTIVFSFAAIVFSEPSTTNAQDAATSTFLLELRGGSIASVAADEEKFDWKTVAPDGAITYSKFNVSDIKALKLATSPASDEVARIRGLVADLADDDYRARHKAERILLDEGKPFQKVIEQAIDHKEPEVRYRVRRIMKFLEKQKEDNTTRFALDFDVLELKNGKKLEGDIGSWALKGTWNNTAVKFDRSVCRFVMTELPFETFAVTPNTEEHVAYGSIFQSDVAYTPAAEDDKQPLGDLKDGFHVADFDVGARGEKMVIDKTYDVGKLFVHHGCLLNCETNNGSVVISGYKFKKSKSRNRSVGNYYTDPIKNKPVRYKGVMRIDFCVPGHPDIPATVNMAALFAEIVVPRETIVEAYNSAGHVVGLTQSASQKNSFLGFSSQEPIAYLRVSKNIYADFEVNNVDFAVDDLTFSPPVAEPSLNFTDMANDTAKIVIITQDDQRLLADSVQFADKSNLTVTSAMAGIEDFKMPLNDIAWITLPQSRNSSRGWWRAGGSQKTDMSRIAEMSLGWWNPTEYGVYVMLTDGSVVHCKFDEKLKATTPGIEIDSGKVIGIWNAREYCRYPRKGDFEHGKTVAVRPLNRVAFGDGDFDWNNGLFDYKLEGAKDLQQGMAAGEDTTVIANATKKNLGIAEDETDPGKLEFADSNASVWTAVPPILPTESGLLRTGDGQQFVLGGNGGYEVIGLDGDTVSLKKGESEFTIQLSNIHSLKLPR